MHLDAFVQIAEKQRPTEQDINPFANLHVRASAFRIEHLTYSSLLALIERNDDGNWNYL